MTKESNGLEDKRSMCPDCDYPLRAETPTSTGDNKTYLVCHMCSKGWDVDKLIQAMIDSKEERKIDQY